MTESKNVRLTKKEIIVLIIAASVVASFILYDKISMREFSTELIFGLSIAAIFYFFVVYIPEQRKRSIIKNNFLKQHIHFKEEVIRILLNASGDFINIDAQKELDTFNAFKKFFKKKDGDMTKWDKVANKLEVDDFLLKKLLFEMEIFMKEASFVLNNIDIGDQKVFDFFKRLSHSVYGLQSLNKDYDGIKQLMRFLWELFTGWDWGIGYREEDIVKIMINKI